MKYNTGFSTDFGLFEIGRTVNGLTNDNLCDERKKLAITLFSKTKSTEALYLELRDMLAVVADDIKHQALTFAPSEASHSYEHPKNLNTILCNGKELGKIGIVHPTVSKKIDKKAAIVFAEIDVRNFSEIKNASIQYQEPSKYPEMEIDVSFVSEKFAPIGDAIKDANCDLIKSVSVVDTYTDENGKSITVRMIFSNPERTLTKEEVMEIVDSIIANLESKGIMMKK